MENIPVIDLAEALNRSMGDASFLRMMLDELCNIVPEFMTRIQNAYQTQNMEELSKDAHQFKGAAANLGAKAIAAAALKLEQIGKSGNPEGGDEALTELKQAIEDFNQKVTQIDWETIPKT
jgi:two-component system, sensor histidine kinase and response regulator